MKPPKQAANRYTWSLPSEIQAIVMRIQEGDDYAINELAPLIQTCLTARVLTCAKRRDHLVENPQDLVEEALVDLWTRLRTEPFQWMSNGQFVGFLDKKIIYPILDRIYGDRKKLLRFTGMLNGSNQPPEKHPAQESGELNSEHSWATKAGKYASFVAAAWEIFRQYGTQYESDEEREGRLAVIEAFFERLHQACPSLSEALIDNFDKERARSVKNRIAKSTPASRVTRFRNRHRVRVALLEHLYDHESQTTSSILINVPLPELSLWYSLGRKAFVNQACELIQRRKTRKFPGVA